MAIIRNLILVFILEIGAIFVNLFGCTLNNSELANHVIIQTICTLAPMLIILALLEGFVEDIIFGDADTIQKIKDEL